MFKIPVPLLIITFMLGAAFLYLGNSYLTISYSQSLYNDALDKFSLANEDCMMENYNSCLNNLLDAESKLIEARSRLNPYDSATEIIYSRIEDTIDEVDLLLAFVSFNKKLDTMKTFENFNIVGLQADPCELRDTAQNFLDDLDELEEDVEMMEILIERDSLSNGSQQQIRQTIEKFNANKKIIEILEPAFDATCIVKTQIEPKTDPDNDVFTVVNLKDDMQLEMVRDKFRKSLDECLDFVKENQKSKVVNFTLNDCSWVKNNLDSVNNLIELVSTSDIEPPEGVSSSELFVTLRDYSDLVSMVDPLNDDIRVLATIIARDYPGGQSVEQAKAIFEYVRDEVVYLLPPLTIHQRVQKPAATLELKAGNCADKSIFAASLYMAVGYKVKAVLQDKQHTQSQIDAGETFTPTHMFVRVEVNDEWYNAEVTCSNCPFDVYTSVNNSTLLEMDIPLPA